MTKETATAQVPETLSPTRGRGHRRSQAKRKDFWSIGEIMVDVLMNDILPRIQASSMQGAGMDDNYRSQQSDWKGKDR